MKWLHVSRPKASENGLIEARLIFRERNPTEVEFMRKDHWLTCTLETKAKTKPQDS